MAPECFEPPQYTMVLTTVGERRLDVMKALRAFRPELSPTEAKHLIDNAPSTLADDVHQYDVEKVANLFLHTGAVVTMTDNAYGHVKVFGPH